MSLTLTLATTLAALNPFKKSGLPTGANAVKTAVSEAEQLRDRSYEARLGEPDIRDFGGQFQHEWKVVIPTYVNNNVQPGNLVFDLPEGRDDEFSTLLELLDALNLTFDELEQVEGEYVPVKFFGGNPTVTWEVLRATTSNRDEVGEEETDDE